MPGSDLQHARIIRRLGWIAGMTPAQRRAVVAANLRVAPSESRARAEHVQQTLLPDLTLAQSELLSPYEYLLYVDLATDLRIAALVATLPSLGERRTARPAPPADGASHDSAGSTQNSLPDGSA